MLYILMKLFHRKEYVLLFSFYIFLIMVLKKLKGINEAYEFNFLWNVNKKFLWNNIVYIYF